MLAVVSALQTLLSVVTPLRVRRDGRTHVVADPPMTRDEAVQWLWEGRQAPPVERFRPDPPVDPPDGSQRRFIFNVTPEEFVAARQDFVDRYLSEGPGWTLEELIRANAPTPWLPDAIVQQLVDLDEAGAFRRSRLPYVQTFPGTAPWGNIVCWVGTDEFHRIVLELFNYFPEDEQFYVNLAGSADRGRLVRTVYVGFNRDLEHFVEERRMAPSAAREEIQRINDLVFRTLMEAVGRVFALGGAQAAAQSIGNQSEATAEAILESFRQRRVLFNLAARRAAPTILMFRGTSMRWRFGDAALTGTHDLGPGVYFSSDAKVAEIYARLKREGAQESLILIAEVPAEGGLGRVLDLTEGAMGRQWDEFVAPILAARGPAGLANEQYFQAFQNFLNMIGRDMNEFDTVIGQEYLRGGRQFRLLRNSRVHDEILRNASELNLDEMP